MKNIAIVRNTFRLHDNPMYSDATDAIVLFVESSRVPIESSFTARTLQQDSPHAYGPHQYSFLLQVIQAHIHDLEATMRSTCEIVYLCGSVEELTQIVHELSGGGEAVCLVDRMTEPPCVSKDNEIEDGLASPTVSCEFLNTRSMVDWRACDPGTLKRLMTVKNRTSIVLTKENREAIADRAVGGDWPLRANPSKQTKQAKQTEALAKIQSDLSGALESMEAAGLRAVRFIEAWGVDSQSLEATVGAALESTRPAMADTVGWQKKDTAANERLHERAAEPRFRCSHLSPFLAVGALSPCAAYAFWNPKGEIPGVGTPADQLLFREIYHATSLLPGFWSSPMAADPGPYPWKAEGQAYWKTTTTGKWSASLERWAELERWTEGTCEPDCEDLNESMVLLRKTGWIHHLRRHVVADYLARGRLRLPWELGELWFRHCLVDHDASVNRGNWLWLSATAYSLAQRVRHYKYKDYIERHSHQCELVSASPATARTRAQPRPRSRRRRATAKEAGGAAKAATATSKKYVTDGFADPLRNTAKSFKVPPSPPPEAARVLHSDGSPPVKNAQEYVFEDAPNFRPNMSPSEVLHAGSFGGTYFRPIYSTVTRKKHANEHLELPAKWLEGLSAEQLCSPVYRKELNTYRVKSGSSLDTWQSSGWINAIDPYGWFQWYCRFWQGRRTTDDERQIGRFNRMAGPTGRFRGQLIRACQKRGASYDDASVSPVIRQSLQHWGYRLT